MNFNPANFLNVVADSPEQLRACDIDRLKSESGKYWVEMQQYLLASNISDRVRNAIN